MLTRILVIDDDVHSRIVLASTLTRLGFNVRVAESGRQGLDLFTTEPADLVITAIGMPESDGIDTIIELKRAGSPPKVIAVTGPGAACGTDGLVLARRAGADDVMAKPLSVSALVEMSKRLLAVQDGGRRDLERRGAAA